MKKSEFVIALVREAEDTADSDDFEIVYCITIELACDSKSSDGPVKEINGRLFIHDNEQLKRWFIMVLSRIISGAVPPLVDEISSHWERGYRLLL